MRSIIIGSDHRGFLLKNKVKKILKSMGYHATDAGCFNSGNTDYPDYARVVAEMVMGGYFDRGILICGTGIGMSITANRYKGIYAARVLSVTDAYLSRAHNNSNVLCLNGNNPPRSLKKILKTWLETEFDGGRHSRRIKKIDAINEASSCYR